MTGITLDGRDCSEKIKQRVKNEVSKLTSESITPKLTTILIGDNPASKLYLKRKHQNCNEVGISSENLELPVNIPENQLLDIINKLNLDQNVNGILIQLPLPKQFSSFKIINQISPLKDVDGLTSQNMGNLLYNQDSLISCTPKGVITLLQSYNIDLSSKYTVIVGRSNLVGKPLQVLLTNLNSTVTLCHSKTQNLIQHTSKADLLISAVGNREQFTVTHSMVKENAIVVDVAINKIDNKLCGDVDFDSVVNKASYITPVPGGIGPMTVASLLENTVIATKLQLKKT